MSEKFYTQFHVADDGLRASGLLPSNVFSGIVEWHAADGSSVSDAVIERLLAEHFDIDIDQLSLVSWCRVH
ncbi:MAG: hypothetical protein AAGF46_01785 [Pseudomonadota bacterium]